MGTLRSFVYFAKLFVIGPVVQVRAVFFSLEKFCEAVPNFKGAAVLSLGAGKIFVKLQNCQILQFADVNLTENVNQVNLILLFGVYQIFGVIKYFGVLKYVRDHQIQN